VEYSTSPTIYIGLFWLDSAQTISHKIASLNKANVIYAIKDYIDRLKIEDAGYANFCKNGVDEWDGNSIDSIEIGPGRLIMFSTLLEGDVRHLS
jgi:hypothetical protein